jgi:hypothetical protein
MAGMALLGVAAVTAGVDSRDGNDWIVHPHA